MRLILIPSAFLVTLVGTLPVNLLCSGQLFANASPAMEHGKILGFLFLLFLVSEIVWALSKFQLSAATNQELDDCFYMLTFRLTQF